MSKMKRRAPDHTLICEELHVNLTRDYTHRNKVVWQMLQHRPNISWNQRGFTPLQPQASAMIRTLNKSWWFWRGKVVLAASLVSSDVGFLQTGETTCTLGGQHSLRVSSGLRCKSLNDPPVVFNDDLVALLQLFMLRLSVHLTHVGHQLLRPEALLHLRQLPLILLHRMIQWFGYFKRLESPFLNWKRSG